MERRFIIFIVLCVVTVVGSQYLATKLYPPKPVPVNSAPSANNAPANNPNAKVVGSENPGLKPAALSAQALAQPEKKVHLKTDTVDIEFSTQGGRITSWKELAFRENQKQVEPVELVPASVGNLSNSLYGALDLPGTDLATRAWSLQAAPAGDGGAQEISFATSLPQGLAFRKTFSIQPGQYFLNVKVEVQNTKSEALQLQNLSLQWGPGIGQPNSEDRYNMLQAVVLTSNSIERVGVSNNDETKVFPSKPRWLALKNHYFVVAIIPADGPWDTSLVERKEKSLSQALAASFNLAPKAAQTLGASYFGGPQDYSLLKKFGNNLQKVVNFGWFEFLAIPMLYILKWFHAVIPNWGLAIILLTILVRAVVWYPTQKSMTSMRKMQKAMSQMQPRLDTLKKTYKDDPQKLNSEMLKLYKEYGVNPVGGCLPMLLQMPILFALYSALQNAFQLRGASFMWLWTDLSAKDPTYILPLAMGATMFLQQKLTPMSAAAATPEQQQQQKMMQYMMPIMLTVMAIWTGWPSGLLLYWTVSNVLSIIQQFYINRATA